MFEFLSANAGNLVILGVAVGLLGAIALLASMLLYGTSKKFAVQEDPRVNSILEVLPGINCGSCGFPGCRGFSEGLLKSSKQGSIAGLFCPPGGQTVMGKVSGILGLSVEKHEPTVAVLRCGGSRAAAPERVHYNGPNKCSLAHNLSAGASLCSSGCLRLGDCVDACEYGAMYMDPLTGLPVIIAEKCISCGACVKACPRNLIAILPRGKKNNRVWVACQNHEKAPIAMKTCKVTCIACGKCRDICPVDAIEVVNNLATINPLKCTACGSCVGVCPTGAILTTLENKNLKEEVTE